MVVEFLTPLGLEIKFHANILELHAKMLHADSIAIFWKDPHKPRFDASPGIDPYFKFRHFFVGIYQQSDAALGFSVLKDNFLNANSHVWPQLNVFITFSLTPNITDGYLCKLDMSDESKNTEIATFKKKCGRRQLKPKVNSIFTDASEATTLGPILKKALQDIHFEHASFTGVEDPGIPNDEDGIFILWIRNADSANQTHSDAKVVAFLDQYMLCKTFLGFTLISRVGPVPAVDKTLLKHFANRKPLTPRLLQHKDKTTTIIAPNDPQLTRLTYLMSPKKIYSCFVGAKNQKLSGSTDSFLDQLKDVENLNIHRTETDDVDDYSNVVPDDYGTVIVWGYDQDTDITGKIFDVLSERKKTKVVLGIVREQGKGILKQKAMKKTHLTVVVAQPSTELTPESKAINTKSLEMIMNVLNDE
jgi:hypothetical protein